jgi:hypothetical protein
MGLETSTIFDLLSRWTYNYANFTLRKKTNLATQDEIINEKTAIEIERLAKQLDMLDKRLDSVDSIVSAVAERVMRQPITINITCPKCGSRIEIGILGTEKPGR